jgi:hypothetical protein
MTLITAIALPGIIVIAADQKLTDPRGEYKIHKLIPLGQTGVGAIWGAPRSVDGATFEVTFDAYEILRESFRECEVDPKSIDAFCRKIKEAFIGYFQTTNKPKPKEESHLFSVVMFHLVQGKVVQSIIRFQWSPTDIIAFNEPKSFVCKDSGLMAFGDMQLVYDFEHPPEGDVPALGGFQLADDVSTCITIRHQCPFETYSRDDAKALCRDIIVASKRYLEFMNAGKSSIGDTCDLAVVEQNDSYWQYTAL